jgi:hypothetical protein
MDSNHGRGNNRGGRNNYQGGGRNRYGRSGPRGNADKNSVPKAGRPPGSIPDLTVLKYGKGGNLDEFTRELIPYCE